VSNETEISHGRGCRKHAEMYSVMGPLASSGSGNFPFSVRHESHDFAPANSDCNKDSGQASRCVRCRLVRGGAMAETITSSLPTIRPSSGWRTKCCNRAAKVPRNETRKQSTRAANRPILILQSPSAFHRHAQRMRLLRPCQLAAFSGKLPSMEAEIGCKLQSNSGKNRNRPKKCVFKGTIIGPNPR